MSTENGSQHKKRKVLKLPNLQSIKGVQLANLTADMSNFVPIGDQVKSKWQNTVDDL